MAGCVEWRELLTHLMAGKQKRKRNLGFLKGHPDDLSFPSGLSTLLKGCMSQWLHARSNPSIRWYGDIRIYLS